MPGGTAPIIFESNGDQPETAMLFGEACQKACRATISSCISYRAAWIGSIRWRARRAMPCGIVMCGLGGDGIADALADCTGQGLQPEGCARAAAQTWGTDRVIAGRNQAATWSRASSRAAMRRFPELEDELAGLTIGGGHEGPGNSPDRADDERADPGAGHSQGAVPLGGAKGRRAGQPQKSQSGLTNKLFAE